jgi:hypothetical protein
MGKNILEQTIIIAKEDMMLGIAVDKIEIWKEAISSIKNTFEWGVFFFETDREKIVWRMTADSFDVPKLCLGLPIKSDEAPAECMRTGQPITKEVPRLVYGIRMNMYAFPIFDDKEVVGSLVTSVPLAHPISRAYEFLAPVIASFFPEGVSLIMTDLEKYTRKVNSDKFIFEGLPLGTMFKDGDLAKKSIQNKRVNTADYPANVFGLPVRVVASPLIDGKDPNRVYGNFIMCLPRKTAVDLQTMFHNLSGGLGEISAAIQQMASSATEITCNEQQLNDNIQEIFRLSEDINNVLGFIKQISNETKMLGLNASIEAARAGELGRGFGVVAEEIRRLSDQSKGTAVTIGNLIEIIRKKIDETVKNSGMTLRSAEEQAAASEEISASVQEITSIAEQLGRIANDI